MLQRHGKEFLEVAEHLLQQGNHREAFFRSAISRAYYATFDYLSFILKKEKVQLSGKGLAHKQLSECLKNCGNNDLKSIGRDINSLRNSRIQADYKTEFAISRSKTEDSISNANIIIEEFEECIKKLNYDEKNSVFGEMNKYLR